MHCYECAKEEVESAAVAICPSCNAALCLRHLREAAGRTGPGGARSAVSTTPGMPPAGAWRRKTPDARRAASWKT